MGNDSIKININTADIDTLTQVSGIGPALAKRIVAERPFQDLDELQSVPGIGSSLLETIKPFLTITDEEETFAEEPILSGTVEEDVTQPEPDPFAVEGETIDADVLPPEDIPPQTARRAVPVGKPVSRNHEVRPPMPKKVDKALLKVDQPQEEQKKKAGFMNNNDNLMYAIIIGVVVLIMSVFLSLGILGAINRGLSYIPARDYDQLRLELDSVISDSEALRQDVDAIQDRLDSLESLSGRLTTLEDDTESLSEEMSTISENMDELEALVESYDQQIETLGERSDTFQQFLEDLRTLLTQLVPLTTNE